MGRVRGHADATRCADGEREPDPTPEQVAVQSRRYLSLVAHARHATDASQSISASITKQRRRLVMSGSAV